MDRTTTEKRDGSDELAGSCEAISSGPPGSNRLIPFPVAAAAKGRDTEDAGVSSASASSFVHLGVPARAVVLRIKQGLPKLRVGGAAGRRIAAPPVDQPGEEEPD